MSILVLGANGYIGHQVVADLVANDNHVVAADVAFEHVPANVSQHFTDLTKPETIAALFDSLRDLDSPLDGAINLAYPRNSQYGRSLFDVTYESFCENVSLHLGGFFEFSKLAALFCQTQQRPFSLVNVSSIYGVIAPKFEIYNGTEMTVPVEYAAIKSALIHLNKYFAAYMKGTRFRINSISPGGILDSQPESFVQKYTENCTGKGMLDANDLFGSIRFLLGAGSEFINGQNLIIDDGFTL